MRFLSKNAIIVFLIIKSSLLFSQDTKTLPSYQIPLFNGLPNFLPVWKSQILKAQESKSIDFQLSSTPLSLNLENEKLITDDYLNNSGSILFLVLEAGYGSKEQRVWMRLMRDLYPTLSNNSQLPNFLRSLKLKESVLDQPLTEKGQGVGGFIKIEIAKNSSPWETRICEKIIPWIHSIQILAGRVQQAENQRKEAFSFHCRLRNFEEIQQSQLHIQLLELPLPLLEPKSKQYFIISPNDLYSSAALQRLQKLK